MKIKQIRLRIFVAAVAALTAGTAFAEEPTAPERQTEIYINSDSEILTALSDAYALQAAGQQAEAVAAYQAVINKYMNDGTLSFVPVSGDDIHGVTYVTPVAAATRKLAELPPEGRRIYHDQIAAAAQAALDAALQSRDELALRHIAERYAASDFGQAARRALGDILFEKGQVAAAEQAYSSLAERSPDAVAKAAYCQALLGRRDSARVLLQTLPGGTALTAFGGQTSLADVLQKLPLAPQHQSATEWPAISGGPARTENPECPEIGSLLWKADADTAALSEDVLPEYQDKNVPLPRIHWPIAAGDFVFLNTGLDIRCYSIVTGQLQWRFAAGQQRRALRDKVGGGAVADGKLYAAVGGRIVALDCSNGDVIWQTDQKTDALFGENLLLSQPAVIGAKVLFTATKTKPEGECYAVVLATDGKLLAKKFLESHSHPRHLGLGAMPAPPAAYGDVAVFCTNLGSLAAIDIQTQSILWLRRYPSLHSAVKRQKIDMADRWAVNAPVILDGKVLAAPQDCSWLYAFDLLTGRVIWRQPRLGARYFGAVGGRACIVGKSVAAIDVATGRRIWSVDLQEAPAGQPVFSSGGILIPTDRFFYNIGTAGTVQNQTATSRLDTGNLCAAHGRVFAGTPFGIAAYQSYAESQQSLVAADTALANLQLGELLVKKQQPAKAIKFLEKARRLLGNENKQSAEALERAYEMLADQMTADPDTATQLRLDALRSAPSRHDKARLLLKIGDRLVERKKPATAINCYQLVLTDHPDEVFEEKSAAIKAGAIAAYKIEQVIAANGAAVFEGQEAKAREMLANTAGFIIEYEKVLKYYPNSQAAVEATETIVKLRLNQGLVQDAVHYVLYATQVLPGRTRPQLLTDAAEMLQNAGRPDLAQFFVRRLVEDDPSGTVQGGTTVVKYAQAYDLGHPKADSREILFAPLSLKWRSAMRLSTTTPELFVNKNAPIADTPFGRRSVFYAVHTDGPRWAMAGLWGRERRSDYIECRTVREGYLLWSQGLPTWEGDLVFSQNRILVRRNGTLTALDANSGATAWQFSTEGGERDFRGVAAVAAAGDQVYVATTVGRVLCFDEARGRTLWEHKIPDVFICRDSMTVFDDRVAVFAENPAGIYVFNKADGREVAARKLNVPGVRMTSHPVYVPTRKLFAVSMSDRIILGLDAKGREVWRTEPGFHFGAIKASPDGDSLVILPGRMGYRTDIAVITASSGRTLWQQEVPQNTMFDAAVDNRGIYTLEAHARSQRVRGYSLTDGKPLFDDYDVKMADLRDLKLAGEHLILTGEQARPRVVVLDKQGRRAFETAPGGAEFISAAVADGMLLVACDRGTFGYGYGDSTAADYALGCVPAAQTAPQLLQAAQSAFEAGQQKAAMHLLAAALEKTDDDAEYTRIYDRLAGVRDMLYEHETPVLRCVKMTHPPEIDGILADDWNEGASLKVEGPAYIEMTLPGPTPDRLLLPGKQGDLPGIPKGINDLSMRIYAGWDDNNLYLAVDVTDRTHRLIRPEEPGWTGDVQIIAIDALNDGGFGYGWGDYLLSQGLMDKPKDDQKDEDIPDGDYAVELKPDHSGVVYESTIPWSYLKEIRPKLGTRFGFGVTVTDDDGPGVLKSISWTPGIYIHKEQDRLSRGFAPELLGDVILTLPEGYQRPAAPEKDEEK